jgi:hypothetical protein
MGSTVLASWYFWLRTTVTAFDQEKYRFSSELNHPAIEVFRDATTARIGSVLDIRTKRKRYHSQRWIFAARIDRKILRQLDRLPVRFGLRLGFDGFEGTVTMRTAIVREDSILHVLSGGTMATTTSQITNANARTGMHKIAVTIPQNTWNARTTLSHMLDH